MVSKALSAQGLSWRRVGLCRDDERSSLGARRGIRRHPLTLETAAFLMASYCPRRSSRPPPRLDIGGVSKFIDRFSDVPLIAISENNGAGIRAELDRHDPSQAGVLSDADVRESGDYLLLVGRISPKRAWQKPSTWRPVPAFDS